MLTNDSLVSGLSLLGATQTELSSLNFRLLFALNKISIVFMKKVFFKE